MQALDDLMFLPSFVFTDWQIELTLLAREVPDLGVSQRPYLPSSFFCSFLVLVFTPVALFSFFCKEFSSFVVILSLFTLGSITKRVICIPG